jgi:NhaA family Na+:H+ antiporter
VVTPSPGRRLPRPVREFLDTESAGGVVLLVGAVVALVWANSPWQHSYRALWETEVALETGRFVLSESLRDWVNDGLMALFFFVVGLEIKRELVQGELRSPRTAALPVLGALGGMVVPAVVFLVVNAGQPGVGGWGIPMATDIAFALGVVALLGPRVPSSLKLFLLTLAVADDVGAIVVIALFYSSRTDGRALGVAAGLVAAIAVLRRARVTWMPCFVVLGVGVWLATLASGIHATIAGVVVGLLTPAHPLAPSRLAREWAEDLVDEPTPAELLAMTSAARDSVSVAERLAHRLHPLTSFVIVPLFALANAGVTLSSGILAAPGTATVAVGVGLGLVVGKAVGITAACWLAVRLGLGALPRGVGWRQMTGIASVAGVGFTVSLFVAGLAFDDVALVGAAKVGILAGSLVAAVAGSALLARVCRRPGGGEGGPVTAPGQAVASETRRREREPVG